MRQTFKGVDYQSAYEECMERYPDIQHAGAYQAYVRDIVSVARICSNKPEVADLCEAVMNGALARGYSYDCKCEFCAAYDIRAALAIDTEKRWGNML